MALSTLVVDDDLAVRKVLTIALENRGIEAYAVASAQQACSLLQTFSFDVVITDMCMGSDVSGLEVLRCAESASRRPLIVVFSALPVAPQAWRVTGADLAYVKGNSLFGMLDEIEQLLLLRMDAKSA